MCFYCHSFLDFFIFFRFLVKAFDAEPCEEDWVPPASQLTLETNSNSGIRVGYEAWGATDPCLKGLVHVCDVGSFDNLTPEKVNCTTRWVIFVLLPGVWQGQRRQRQRAWQCTASTSAKCRSSFVAWRNCIADGSLSFSLQGTVHWRRHSCAHGADQVVWREQELRLYCMWFGLICVLWP